MRLHSPESRGYADVAQRGTAIFMAAIYAIITIVYAFMRRSVAWKQGVVNTILISVRGSFFARALAMSRLVLIGRYVRSFLEVFSAAQAVTVAIQAHRRPSGAALKVLGISPEQFRTIRA